MIRNLVFPGILLVLVFVIGFSPPQASAINQFNFTTSNIAYQSTITSSGAKVGYTVTATANGTSVTPTCNPVSGSLFIFGNTPVYCSAADNDGNVGAASFIITVNGTDSVPPNIIPPPNITKYRNQNQTDPLTIVDIGVPLVNDNLDTSPLVINDYPSNTGFPLNSTLVTWTAIDHSGNSNTANQTVTVKIFEGVIVNANPPGGLYKIVQSVVLSNNSTVPIYYTVDGAIPTTSSAIYNNPIPVNFNMTLKFFSTPDEFGNPQVLETETYAIDASPPVITLNGLNPVMHLQNTPYVDAGATANDNHDGNITPLIVTSGLSIDTSVSGSYPVTYNVLDAAGNAAAQVTRTVIVTTITTLMSDTTASSGLSLHPGRPIHAEYVSPTSRLVGDKIDSITLKLRKNFTPTGVAQIGVFNDDLSVKKLFVNQTISTIAGSSTDYTFSLPSGQTYQIQSGDRIGIKFTGVGDGATNYIAVTRDTNSANPFDGTNSYHTYFETTWKPTSGFDSDLYMILKGPLALNSPDDATPPVITLRGSNPTISFLNSNYVDSGATAIDNVDGNVTSSIVTVDSVNESIIGSYPVTYNVLDVAGNAAIQVTRTVNVVDNTIPTVSPTPLAGIYNSTQNITLVPSNPSIIYYTTNGVPPTTSSPVFNIPIPINTNSTVKFFAKTLTGNSGLVTSAVYTIDTISPVITLNGNTQVLVDIGSPYADAGATANDNVDGNLTSSIVTVNPVNTSILGSYAVKYNVLDAAGNAAVASRTVEVIDQVPPVITLHGSNPVTAFLNFPYVDAGATATDNVDGNLTSSIVTVNSVNSTKVDSYTVTYNVSDVSGNLSPEIVRNVIVVADFTPPVITLITPTPGSSVNQFNVAYTLSEDVSSGTITFTRTSGISDGLTHIYNFAADDKTIGVHSISMAVMETGFGNSLVNGAVYTITVTATDFASNSATPAINTSITYSNTIGTCSVPLSGDWVISSGCKITGIAHPLGNVDIQNGAIVTIENGGTLNIDSLTKHLMIHYGSGILIKSGGKIS